MEILKLIGPNGEIFIIEVYVRTTPIPEVVYSKHPCVKLGIVTFYTSVSLYFTTDKKFYSTICVNNVVLKKSEVL